jgi:Sec-independent protein secretion pathway component TatC
MYNPNMEDNSFEKMPLGQHLDDLRKVLLRALLGLMAGVIAGAFFVKPVLDFFARPIGGVENLQVIEVTESVSVYMRVALLIGLIVALPWIFFQLFSFIGKGLKKSEKRGLLVAIPFATILFLVGGGFAFFCDASSLNEIFYQFAGSEHDLAVEFLLWVCDQPDFLDRDEF